MNAIVRLSILFVSILMLGCSRPTPKVQEKESGFPLKYENVLFSVNLPKGWTIDDSGWKGLDSLQNEVNLYGENEIVWFHFVKCFMPIEWKGIEEATEMAKEARAMSGDNAKLIDEIDSVEVGGYPATILYFVNYVDNDTIIQKQFVTYLEDSHIVILFNENFSPRDWDEAQNLGDAIMRTVKIHRVRNPLDDDDKLRQNIDKLSDRVQGK